MVAAFNRAYTQLRDRQFDLHRRAPEIRVRADADVVRLECRLETPRMFAAPTEPPPFEPAANVTLCIAASVLEEQCLASLSGRQLSAAELSKTIGELLGAPADKAARQQDFRATFAEHPCDIQFASGQIRAKFYVTSFVADDVEYPAMTVDAEYNVEGRDGSLALVRQGSLRVRPLAERGEATPALSGRQQTLRLAAQRKLNRALAETYLWAGPAWETAGKQTKTLPILRVSVENGWLQLAFGEPPAPSGPREVKWQPDKPVTSAP